MYSTYDSANKLAELQNNCSILVVNILNLCDYVIIDKIQDSVCFGLKNLNMRYPHTCIIIPVYSYHYSWLLSLFHASIQLVILGNHFFVPMVQILCDYIIIDTIRYRSDVICNGIVSKQNTRVLYVSSMVWFLATIVLSLHTTGSDIRPHMKWTVSQVIAYGYFNLPQGFVWVCWITFSPLRGMAL